MMSNRGRLRAHILALAVCIGVGIPGLAEENGEVAIDAEVLAIGEGAWNRAACSTCHGRVAQGGGGVDSPAGPSLRTTLLNKETMTLFVSCGLPGTPMPAWLKGAYTEVECYGLPLGERPESGVTITGLFPPEEIQALVDYIYATFVQTPQTPETPQ